MRLLPGFRFHLSTAFICMIVAGGFVGLNTAKRTVDLEGLGRTQFNEKQSWVGFKYGWPYSHFISQPYYKNHPTDMKLEDPKDPERFDRDALIVNLIIGLGIVAAVAFALESLIRFRQTRSAKPEN